MINVVVLMGRLVADPELRTTPSGVSVTTFRIAVDRSYVKAGEQRQADFIDIVAWRQQAEFVSRYFHKGSMIAVQGSIQTRSYQAKDGTNRTAFEVVADQVSFTGSKSESGSGNYGGNPSAGFGSAQQAQPQRPAVYNEPAPAYTSGSDLDFTEIESDDDLPF
ncbi:MAG: single-stranded DNA-binding protein [Clostridia bacterium]|nr:single-stranded DNA-binding protein [Clostridia bacterium]